MNPTAPPHGYKLTEKADVLGNVSSTTAAMAIKHPILVIPDVHLLLVAFSSRMVRKIRSCNIPTEI